MKGLQVTEVMPGGRKRRVTFAVGTLFGDESSDDEGGDGAEAAEDQLPGEQDVSDEEEFPDPQPPLVDPTVPVSLQSEDDDAPPAKRPPGSAGPGAPLDHVLLAPLPELMPTLTGKYDWKKRSAANDKVMEERKRLVRTNQVKRKD